MSLNYSHTKRDTLTRRIINTIEFILTIKIFFALPLTLNLYLKKNSQKFIFKKKNHTNL